MSKQLLIEKVCNRLSCAVMENSRLLSYAEEQTGIQAEQIYLAKVDRIMKGTQTVFLRLTAHDNGYLPLSECKEKPVSGQTLLVQVKKPAIGEKLPFCSTDISIAGRYAILTPFSPRITVSVRIVDAEKAASLKALGSRLAPEKMGLILRSECAEVGEETLQAEIAQLHQKWLSIAEKAKQLSAPCLLEEREAMIPSILRDEKGGFEKIITNLEVFPYTAPCPVQYAEHPFSLQNVWHKLQKSLSRKVYLPCGGYLILDRTEAMTVIDVNSGKFQGKKSGTESTFLSLNTEAAKEIARLVRLRNLGGIILIDFVDMEKEESRNAVLSALSDALKDDPVKTVLHGFTSLGLLEMTRKKTSQTLASISPCPHCRGTGLKEENT